MILKLILRHKKICFEIQENSQGYWVVLVGGEYQLLAYFCDHERLERKQPNRKPRRNSLFETVKVQLKITLFLQESMKEIEFNFKITAVFQGFDIEFLVDK